MIDTHRAAALTVVRHASGTADARLLLEALGLIDGPDGHELLPEPAFVLPLGDVGPSAGAAEPPPRRVESDPDLRRPERSTAPPGLRAAVPAPEPVPARPRTQPAPRPHVETPVTVPALDELSEAAQFVAATAPDELAELAALSRQSRQPRPDAIRPDPPGEASMRRALSATPDQVRKLQEDAAWLAADPDNARPDGPYVDVRAIDELFVDHSYQRPLDQARVKRMAPWNPRLVVLIDVSDRGPGTDPVNRYAIVNGQHRAAAAARAGVTHLACNVHEGLNVADEARLMAELDRTTKKLSGLDQWRARRGAGDPVVATVERIAAGHGLTVSGQRADGVLTSYGAAEKLLKVGGEQLLGNTLAVLRGAYGAAAAAWQAPIVTGVGQLLHAHPTVDVDRVTRALSDTSPTQLRAHATTAREIDGGTLADSVTRVLAGLHNKTSGPGPRISGTRG